jgi:hypothetical protein
MHPTLVEGPAVSPAVLRPLLGARVIVRTASALWRGTLLSCVKDSAWFVVDDVDVVVPLDDLVSVRPPDRAPRRRRSVCP